MADNLTGNNVTGIGETTGSNRTDWRPTDNGGLSQGESAGFSQGQGGGLSQGQSGGLSQGQGGGLSQGYSQRDNAANSGGDKGKTPSGLTAVAHEYTDKISDAVSQAKDYIGEKAGNVGGKIKEFATDDLSGLAEKAKDFARQNPGQAILVSAAAGVLLGLIVRGRR